MPQDAIRFNGNSFMGDSDSKYEDDILECNDNEDCNITCMNNPNSCKNAIIECPLTGNCDIMCNSGSSGFLNPNDVCQGIIVNCPINGNCTISCNDNTACESATINGNTSTILTILCEGGTACQNSIIDAKNTNNLILRCGTTGSNTCTSLSIYFPPNINGHKRATISAGDNSFSAGNGNPMLFYAIYGWMDVNIINYTGDYQYQIGTMFCQYGYITSCTFKSDAWECANIDDICNNPPTLSPTHSPNIATSTRFPSDNPTKIPSNIASNNPTISPSKYPIKIPSKSPINITSKPTIYPTYKSIQYTSSRTPIISLLLTNTKFIQTDKTEATDNNISDVTSNIISQQQSSITQSIFSLKLLYVIIGILVFCLCCFGSILLYFMYHSQEYTQKLQHHFSKSIYGINDNSDRDTIRSISGIPDCYLPTSPTSKSTVIPSILSSFSGDKHVISNTLRIPIKTPNCNNNNSNSDIIVDIQNINHTQKTGGKGGNINNNNNININTNMIEMVEHKHSKDTDSSSLSLSESSSSTSSSSSSSSCTISSESGDDEAADIKSMNVDNDINDNGNNNNNNIKTEEYVRNGPWQYFVNNDIDNIEHHNESQLSGSNISHYQAPQPPHIDNHYFHQLMVYTQSSMPSSSLRSSEYHSNPPLPPSLSSTIPGQQILYQQPSQQQMYQMMQIMNNSAPPSLSSIVNNHRVYPQPLIPPSSATHSGSNSSHIIDSEQNELLRNRHLTITTKEDTETDYMKPSESIISGITSITASIKDDIINDQEEEDEDEEEEEEEKGTHHNQRNKEENINENISESSSSNHDKGNNDQEPQSVISNHNDNDNNNINECMYE